MQPQIIYDIIKHKIVIKTVDYYVLLIKKVVVNMISKKKKCKKRILLEQSTKSQKDLSKPLCFEEYSSLRNEITSVQEQQRNIWITMYTLYVALFVVAFERSSYYILLTSYMILIPFQHIINTQNWSVQKLSSYIICFFESEDSNIHWEGLHSYPKYRDYYKKHGDSKYLNYMGATILGAISTICFISDRIYIIYNNRCTHLIFDIFMMLLAVSLLFITFMINLKYTNRYHNELYEIMNDYKSSIYNK